MKHLIIIVFLGSLLSCTGQPSGGDANSTPLPNHPYRFHCYTSHIYVDAFLNDSPNQVLYFKPEGESLWARRCVVVAS